MKKQIAGAALAAAMALSAGAFAQQQSTAPVQDQQQKQGDWGHGRKHRGMHGKMDPQARLDRMSQFLSLSEDQKARIKPVLESEKQQMQALKQDSSMAREDRRAKAMEIHKNTMDQIRPVLNSDQQAKLEQQMQRMKDRRGKGGRMGDPQARFERMSEFLSLTDDQKVKIKPILDNEAQQMQALRQESSSDRRAKAMELRKNTLDQIRPILNSEQQAKLDQQIQRMREHRGKRGGRGWQESGSSQNQ